jgi:4,5-dihydroxyphthalate decarboxylase
MGAEGAQPTRHGSGVPITVACALYDRMQALYTGSVQAEGIDLTFKVCEHPRMLFDSAMAMRDFDVCEMSSSDYAVAVSEGRSPFVALPVFPSKSFRHGNIFVHRKSGIKTPKDLEGKRVGVMRYTMTAAVWMRAHLQNQYGVDLAKVHWIEGQVNAPGRHGVPTIIPAGTTLTVNESGKSLSDLIDKGEIDAVMGTHMPNSRFTNPDVVRLFPDFKAEEKKFYRDTGIFPIMHLIAVKRETYEKNPFIARSLYKAFDQSKAHALKWMASTSAMRSMSPWLPETLDENREIFGGDPWVYGLEPNRKTMEALVTALVQQGMIAKPIPIEELFVKVD